MVMLEDGRVTLPLVLSFLGLKSLCLPGVVLDG
jgi:hypothetical protein